VVSGGDGTEISHIFRIGGFAEMFVTWEKGCTQNYTSERSQNGLFLLCRTSSTTLQDSLGCEMVDGRVRLNNGGRQRSRKGKRKRGIAEEGT